MMVVKDGKPIGPTEKDIEDLRNETGVPSAHYHDCMNCLDQFHPCTKDPCDEQKTIRNCYNCFRMDYGI